MLSDLLPVSVSQPVFFSEEKRIWRGGGKKQKRGKEKRGYVDSSFKTFFVSGEIRGKERRGKGEKREGEKKKKTEAMI